MKAIPSERGFPTSRFVVVLGLLVALAFLGSAAVPRSQAAEPLVTEGLIEAPVKAVWEAFTTSAGLRSWMAPLADIDLKLDGKMRANYRSDGVLGDTNTIVNRILSFEPERMLSIRVDRAPTGFPFPEAVKSMWTVIHFEPAAENRTRMRVVGLGFTDEPESVRMRAFFDRGNAYTLQMLQEKFAPPRKPAP